MTVNYFKWVVSVVGACLIVAVVGIILLAFQDKTIPDVLQNVAVGSLTALVGLLVRPASMKSP